MSAGEMASKVSDLVRGEVRVQVDGDAQPTGGFVKVSQERTSRWLAFGSLLILGWLSYAFIFYRPQFRDGVMMILGALISTLSHVSGQKSALAQPAQKIQ